MNRRNALLALSGVVTGSVLLARPVLAQAPMLVDATGYRQGTLIGGSFAKEASQAALAQATHPRVKQFAQFEVEEQTALAQVLTDLNNPPPTPLDSGHAAALASLRARSGADFDLTYVQAQIASHRELLQLQTGFLDSRPSDTDLRHVAILARTSITMHLTLLAELQTMLPG